MDEEKFVPEMDDQSPMGGEVKEEGEKMPKTEEYYSEIRKPAEEPETDPTATTEPSSPFSDEDSDL